MQNSVSAVKKYIQSNPNLLKRGDRENPFEVAGGKLEFDVQDNFWDINVGNEVKIWAHLRENEKESVASELNKWWNTLQK